jgi:CheY-like chemotaxis protein
MDGLRLIGDWRKNGSNEKIPAIALSGYVSKADVEAALAAGFDLHLAKPFDPSELIREIERLLAKQAQPLASDN